MKTRTFRFGIALFALATAVTLLGLNLKDRWDLKQRRHQIGSLWSAARIHYAPKHQERMPMELEELRPIFHNRGAEALFETAIQSTELVSPGVSLKEAAPGTVFLQERKSDSKGKFWVHDLDGTIRLETTNE